MKSKAGRLIGSILRWGVAVLGIVWVVSNLHLRDRVLVLDDANLPVDRVLARPVAEDAATFDIESPPTARTVPRERVVNGPDRKTVTLIDGTTSPLLGMRLTGDLNHGPAVESLLVKDPAGRGRFVAPGEVRGGFVLDVPQPRVQRGLISMLKTADSSKLLLALLVAPLTFVFTTIRWRRLLASLGVHLSLGRTLVLNMVGAFYNTFMPGSTGGDVLKAYYAAKQAPDHRTAAVMSVLIDRVLGLISLVILGGGAAAFQYFRLADKHDPVARSCAHVAIVSAAILTSAVVGVALLYTPAVRRAIVRIDLLNKSKAFDLLRKAMSVMHRYRERPGLIVWAVVITFPVHAATVVSAMLAGQALGLPLSAGYYFIVVPVVVLAGAIPLSPQGVGVMEAFAYYFTRPQGATLNQALALTLSIRLVAVFWNLVGGLFVLRGGYHAPTTAERRSVDEADDLPNADATDTDVAAAARSISPAPQV